MRSRPRAAPGFTDTVSGKLERRPELDKLLERLLPGDVMVVWRLDRLGRSLKHLVGFLAELGERGVQFRSLTEAIDTTTASGKLLFHIMGSLAEFERALIVERTRGEDKIALIRQLYDSREHCVDAIARMVGVGRTTVYRSLEATERRSGPPPAPVPVSVKRGRSKRKAPRSPA